MTVPALLALFIPALLAASPARAVPPDARVVMAPGTERFLRAGFVVTDVAVDPPGRLEAELLPSEEILVTVPADAALEQATVLAIGVDRIHAFEVCVSRAKGADCPPPTSVFEAKKACPDLSEGREDGETVVTGTVRDVPCLDALRAALARAELPPGSLRLVLEETPARAFFGRVTERIKNDPEARGLKAAYYGATLRLQGNVPRAAVRRALVHAYRETVGRVSYEDRTVSPPATR